MAATQVDNEQADRLYRQYGKPLEQEHWGEYLAISSEGKTLLAPSLLEAVERATDTFGPGSFIFKVGEKTVGKWLWLRNG
jgi:hypothetical protein